LLDTCSYVDNSLLVSQIAFTNSGVQRMVTTRSYDNLNRLTTIQNSVSGSNVTSSSYAYNSANQRTSVTRGNDLSQTLQGAGGIGGLLARTDNSQLLAPNSSLQASAFYNSDGNGNITCLINASNTLVASYQYDPYGNIISQSGSLADANLYRFSSKEVHPTSGLVYYLYRYYEPNFQRWLNRDPIQERGGLNLYEFNHNGSINWFDANGLDSTIQCDGNGNYEVALDAQDSASPSKKCIEQHEKDHIKDWEKRYGKNSCKGKKRVIYR
jgi:RHS repeat-associated protein